MILSIDNLRKKYGSKIAVNDITINFQSGVYGLLGANGAGKTTFMKMIVGLLESTSGTVFYNGVDIRNLKGQYLKDIGYLPQEFYPYVDFTVENFLEYIAAVKGLNKNIIKKKVEEVIEVVSLKEKSKKKIKTLSGGMKRRLGIAQAILNEPKILVLDEPTAGLDPNERIRFRNFLSKLSGDKVVLISTHIVSDIESIANKIIIMKNGKKIDEGTSEELTKKLEGYVWECKIPEQSIDNFQEKYNISNMKLESGIVLCRIVSKEKPIENAIELKPKLEDTYVYYFNEKE